MRLGRLLIIGTIAAAASACSSLGALTPWQDETASTSVEPMPGQLEPIHAAALVNNVAVFWVSSNGCTSKDDLRPFVQTHGDASVITLRRISEDRCHKPLNDGVEIQWSYQELGLKPGDRVSINNPYQLPAPTT